MESRAKGTEANGRFKLRPVRVPEVLGDLSLAWRPPAVLRTIGLAEEAVGYAVLRLSSATRAQPTPAAAAF